MARIFINEAEKVLPGLSDHIEVMDVCSPHTIGGYTLSTHGTILGYGFIFNRLYNELRDYGAGTTIKHLHLNSGGGGQPLAILGGILTASSIITRDPYSADLADF